MNVSVECVSSIFWARMSSLLFWSIIEWSNTRHMRMYAFKWKHSFGELRVKSAISVPDFAGWGVRLLSSSCPPGEGRPLYWHRHTNSWLTHTTRDIHIYALLRRNCSLTHTSSPAWAHKCTYTHTHTHTHAHTLWWRGGPDGQGGMQCPVSVRDRERTGKTEREKRESGREWICWKLVDEGQKPEPSGGAEAGRKHHTSSASQSHRNTEKGGISVSKQSRSVITASLLNCSLKYALLNIPYNADVQVHNFISFWRYIAAAFLMPFILNTCFSSFSEGSRDLD